GQIISSMLVDNNTSITLQPSGTNTLTINGSTAATNLSVTSGSTLTIGGGASVLTLAFATTVGQVANIAGTLTIASNGTVNSSVATTTWNVPGNITLNAV